MELKADNDILAFVRNLIHPDYVWIITRYVYYIDYLGFQQVGKVCYVEQTEDIERPLLYLISFEESDNDKILNVPTANGVPAFIRYADVRYSDQCIPVEVGELETFNDIDPV